MVVKDAIDNLKDRPHEEKKAVASGIAIGVVIILLVGWSILFLRKVQNPNAIRNLSAGQQDQFNFDTVQQAQQQLKQGFASTSDELQRIRDAAQDSLPLQQQVMQSTQGAPSQFGVPSEPQP